MNPRETGCSGLTPFNGSRLIKATFNTVFSYGMEIVPIIPEHTG